MAVRFDKGIVVDGKIVLDKTAKHTVETAFITHAHADHVNLAGDSEVIASKETIELIKAIYGKEKKFVQFDGEKEIKGFNVSTYEAGHMLGAKQILLEKNNERILYTGDLNTQGSIIDKKAEVVEADTLIIEATYGMKQYDFPKREVVYNQITEWVEKQINDGTLVIMPCYNVGKTQELTALASQLKPKLMVHEKLFKMNKIYENLGTKLGNYELMNGNLENADVALIPYGLVNKSISIILEKSLKRKVLICTASGFNNRGADKSFSLSSHSDFKELMEFAEKVKPKKVFTVYGHARELAFSIKRKLGISAVALKQGGFQSDLNHF